MKINESTFEITTSQYDWGTPVIFEAGTDQGFEIGDKIVFVFDTDKIEDRVYTVNASDFTFSLALTEEEADRVWAVDIRRPVSIRYSVKRYVEDQFLETLVDSKLIVNGTVRWGGESDG